MKATDVKAGPVMFWRLNLSNVRWSVAVMRKLVCGALYDCKIAFLYTKELASINLHCHGLRHSSHRYCC